MRVIHTYVMKRDALYTFISFHSAAFSVSSVKTFSSGFRMLPLAVGRVHTIQCFILHSIFLLSVFICLVICFPLISPSPSLHLTSGGAFQQASLPLRWPCCISNTHKQTIVTACKCIMFMQ